MEKNKRNSETKVPSQKNGPLRMRLAAEASTKKTVDNFFVVLVRKSADAETNENEVIDLGEKAVAALEADKTFGGKCFDSWVRNREKQKIFQGDYDIVAVRLNVHTERLWN